MRVATVAPASFLSSVFSRGGLRAREPIFEDSGAWRPAYAFMREELARKSPLGARKGARWPVWLWPLAASARVLDELRSERRRRPAAPAIALIFEIPRRRLLLSRYGLWHSCLNNSPIHLSEADWDAWIEKTPGFFDGPRPCACDIGAGWRWIFPCLRPDASQPAESFDWLGDLSQDDLQAVAWGASEQQIRGAWALTPAGRRIKLGARGARRAIKQLAKKGKPRERSAQCQRMLSRPSPFAKQRPQSATE